MDEWLDTGSRTGIAIVGVPARLSDLACGHCLHGMASAAPFDAGYLRVCVLWSVLDQHFAVPRRGKGHGRLPLAVAARAPVGCIPRSTLRIEVGAVRAPAASAGVRLDVRVFQALTWERHRCIVPHAHCDTALHICLTLRTHVGALPFTFTASDGAHAHARARARARDYNSSHGRGGGGGHGHDRGHDRPQSPLIGSATRCPGPSPPEW